MCCYLGEGQTGVDSHETPISGHPGNKIRDRYQARSCWPSMGEDKAFCQTCEVCQLMGNVEDSTKGLLQLIPFTPYQSSLVGK